MHVLPGAACGMAYLLNYILYVNWQQQVCLCSLFVFHFHFFFLCFYGFSCLFTMLSVKLWLMLVFGMETYQCIGISHISEKRDSERERLDWQPIKIEFIAKFIVSLSIFYWTISPNCNLSHSFQLVSTWFGHFMLSCCDETFLALWCCHKSRRFPPVLHFHCSDACREFVFRYFSSSLPNMPSLLMRWEFGKLTMW